MYFSRVCFQDIPENDAKKEPVSYETGSSGRGTRIRTQNKGFGDPRVTITPCPYGTRDIIPLPGRNVNMFVKISPPFFTGAAHCDLHTQAPADQYHAAWAGSKMLIKVCVRRLRPISAMRHGQAAKCSWRSAYAGSGRSMPCGMGRWAVKCS